MVLILCIINLINSISVGLLYHVVDDEGQETTGCPACQDSN